MHELAVPVAIWRLACAFGCAWVVFNGYDTFWFLAPAMLTYWAALFVAMYFVGANMVSVGLCRCCGCAHAFVTEQCTVAFLVQVLTIVLYWWLIADYSHHTVVHIVEHGGLFLLLCLDVVGVSYVVGAPRDGQEDAQPFTVQRPDWKGFMLVLVSIAPYGVIYFGIVNAGVIRVYGEKVDTFVANNMLLVSGVAIASLLAAYLVYIPCIWCGQRKARDLDHMPLRNPQQQRKGGRFRTGRRRRGAPAVVELVQTESDPQGDPFL